MRLPMVLYFLLAFLMTGQLLAQPQEMSMEMRERIFTSLDEALETPLQVYRLHLIGQDISDISPLIAALTNLEELDLSENQLAELPAAMGALKRLRHLNLANNRLTELPSIIAEWEQLQSLDISTNQLTNLPPQIASLQKLRVLDIADNQLEALPLQLGGLEELVSLDASGNQLSTLPPQIGELRQLRRLSVGNNQLTALPAAIRQMENLVFLDVSGNQITALPTEIGELKMLEASIWADNPVKFVPRELFPMLARRDYFNSRNIQQLAEADRRQNELRLQAAELQIEKTTRDRDQLARDKLLKDREIAQLREIDRQREIVRRQEAALRQKEQQAQKSALAKAQLEREFQQTLNGVLALGLLLGAIFLLITGRNLYLQTRQRRKIESQKILIEREQAKSEQLLLNILPQEVADELKANGTTQTRYYAAATVMFADIKGFSAYSRRVSPQQLIQELNLTFSQFDEIVEKYGLERIKTIGDSYMCVAGVPHPSPTHARDAILAALDMQAWMLQEAARRAGDYWELRMGIHTGELVAGVIGKTKFAYDVWGDTVNTASRVESGGGAGKVSVSEAVYALVKDYVQATPRGKIEAKNIGYIETYYIDGLLPEYQYLFKG